MHAIELDPQKAAVNVSLVSQQYEGNGVTIILDWMQGSPLYSYHVIITPQLKLVLNESTGVQVTLLYNIIYTFTVVAVHPRGQHNVTSLIKLNYSEFH